MGSDPAGRLIIGAMSGTSADGVDVALVRVTGRGLEMRAELVRHHHLAYDATLRASIFARRSSGESKFAELAQLGRQITLAYVTATNELLTAAGVDVNDVSAVAAHGQTLYHEPPNTIQWFDPSLLSAETNIAVVSDFRRADCAAGGQGAPLVPFADYILFRHPTKNRVLLNIGGIANLTYLPAGGGIDDVIAFDTGPGNCISDWICRQRGPFGLSWDVDGSGASRGKVLEDVVRQFSNASYFASPPPKSTDGPSMIAAFEKAMGPANHDMNDLLATASFATAATIERGRREWLPASPAMIELFVSGGGILNKAMMGWLQSAFRENAIVRSATVAGFVSEAKEAVAFALLGAATLDGEPSNVPSATGATRRAVLGSITPKP